MSLRTAYVVRHADAGDRSAWTSNDSQRPLSEKGRWQAGMLSSLLGITEPTTVYSSPAVRCVQTVEPLATSFGGKVRDEVRCAEGMPASGLLDLILGSSDDLVACSHGDVIGELVWRLHDSGLVGREARFQKASTWRLTFRDGEIREAVYIPPPKR